MRFGFILLCFSCMFLSGCHNQINYYSSYITTDYKLDGTFNVKIVKEGQSTSKSFKLKADVSYSFFDFDAGILFAYGPGGLIRIDGETDTISMITDHDVSHVFGFMGQYGFIENNGFTKNGYSSTLHLDMINENTAGTIELGYPVNQAVFCDGTIFVTNFSGYTNDYYAPYLFQYSLDGTLIDQKQIGYSTGIGSVNNNLFEVRRDGIYQQDLCVVPCHPSSMYVDLFKSGDTLFSASLNWSNCELFINDKLVMTDVRNLIKISDSSFLIRQNEEIIEVQLTVDDMKTNHLSIARELIDSPFFRLYPLTSTGEPLDQ